MGYADRILCLWHRARSEARVASPDNPQKRKSSHISFAEAYKYTKSTSFSPSICYVRIRTVKSPVDSSGLSSSRRDGVSIADTAPGGISRQPCIKTGTPTGMPQSPIKNQSPRVLPLGLSGAATRIRTGDLILTKDVLYQLSHSSITQGYFLVTLDYYSKYFRVCQYIFQKNFRISVFFTSGYYFSRKESITGRTSEVITSYPASTKCRPS